MKKSMTLLLVAAMLLTLLAGCRWGQSEPTEGTSAPAQTEPSTAPTLPTEETFDGADIPMGAADTRSAKILENIWSRYGDADRFAAFGGAVENSVTDGPGDLDITNTEELTSRYLVPQTMLTAIDEAASLVHMMNNNIFTGAVFHLTQETSADAFAEALWQSLQDTQWICGSPDRALICEVETGYVLMAFGAEEILATFRSNLKAAYPENRELYEEAIAG